ncbi:MAG: hypothetical protein ACI8TQ_002847 [Planctomycetota bacterium]|jgi:hypothetical protein
MHPAFLNLALALIPVTSPNTGNEAQVSPTSDLFSLYSAGLDKILADPRDGGLHAWLTNLRPMMDAVAKQNGEPLPEPIAMAARWMTQPLNLSVNVGESGLPDLQFDISWADRALARKEFAEFRKSLEQAGIVLAASDADAGSMTANIMVGTLSAKLIDLDKSATLSITFGRDRQPAFQVSSYSLPAGIEPTFAVHLNGSSLTELVESNLGDKQQDQMLKQVLNRLSLIGPNALDMNLAQGHGSVESITTMHIKGWSDSFLGKVIAGQLEMADIKLLPKDTLVGGVGNINISSLFELAREIDKVEVNKALGLAKVMTGLDVEADLFNRIGPTMGFYSSRGTGGAGGPMGLVMFAECIEPMKVMQSIGKLIQLAEKQSEMKLSATNWEHGEIVCTTYGMPGTAMPVEPCVAISGDKLFVALSRNALIEALDQSQRKESILDNQRVAMLPKASLNQLVSFGFYDADFGLERGYSSIGMLQSTVNNMLASAQSGIDTSMLPNFASLVPSLTQLKRNSRPTVSLTYVKNGDLLAATTHDSSVVARLTATAGSPLSSGGLASTAIASSITIPNLMSARLSANESAAISTLRSLSSAQAMMWSISQIDTDSDGGGEYGTFGELTGVRNLRGTDEMLNPPVLGKSFASLIADGQGGAVIMRSGYYFQIGLPGADGSMINESADDADVSKLGIDHDNAEIQWCAYAWPVTARETGNRAFYIDQEGDLLQAFYPSGYAPFSGLTATGGNQPIFDSADGQSNGNMSQGMTQNTAVMWSVIQ